MPWSFELLTRQICYIQTSELFNCYNSVICSLVTTFFSPGDCTICLTVVGCEIIVANYTTGGFVLY